MTRIHSCLLILSIFFTLTASAQSTTTPPSADEVVKAACKEAASSHRKVFILFHASWCGWCHRMDSLLLSPVCKQLFQDHYVIRHLVIMENDNKKSLENPGAQELYTRYAGEKGLGIPFWLVVDKSGTVIADSRIKPQGAAPGSAGDNSGCPDTPGEVAYFLQVLQATSSLSADQLQTIGKQFAGRKG